MFKNLPCRFVLGSTSPRRRDILKMVELDFVQKSPQFDESELMKRDDLSSEKLVQMIAEKKVKSKFIRRKNRFALGRKRGGSSADRLFNLLRYSNRFWEQNLRQAGGQSAAAWKAEIAEQK